MSNFRYYDHPRNVIALMRAQLTGDASQVAQTARERGIPIDVPDAKLLRETLWEMTSRATFLLQCMAGSTGRTPEAILDEWQVQIEAQIPEGHNDDEPRDL